MRTFFCILTIVFITSLVQAKEWTVQFGDQLIKAQKITDIPGLTVTTETVEFTDVSDEVKLKFPKEYADCMSSPAQSEIKVLNLFKMVKNSIVVDYSIDAFYTKGRFYKIECKKVEALAVKPSLSGKTYPTKTTNNLIWYVQDFEKYSTTINEYNGFVIIIDPIAKTQTLVNYNSISCPEICIHSGTVTNDGKRILIGFNQVRRATPSILFDLKTGEIICMDVIGLNKNDGTKLVLNKIVRWDITYYLLDTETGKETFLGSNDLSRRDFLVSDNGKFVACGTAMFSSNRYEPGQFGITVYDVENRGYYNISSPDTNLHPFEVDNKGTVKGCGYTFSKQDKTYVLTHYPDKPIRINVR